MMKFLKRALKILAGRIFRTKVIQYHNLVVEGPFADYGLLEAMRKGNHESYFEELLLTRIEPGHVFVDIGAHLGKYSLLAAKKMLGQGRVLAFEPHPRTFEFLARNIKKNKFETIIEAHNLAISPQVGEATLFADFLQSDFTSMVSVRDAKDAKAVRIRTTNLEACSPSLSLNCLKIDVEGAEPIVLEGCEAVLHRSRAEGKNTTLFIECNPEALYAGGSSPELLLEQLKKLGFLTMALIDENQRTLVPIRAGSPVPGGNWLCQ